MIAITIFIGKSPLGLGAADRAISTEVHHAEKVTPRAQPTVVESNAVPDRPEYLTDYETAAFRPSANWAGTTSKTAAQTLGRAAYKMGTAGPGHKGAHGKGNKKVFR
jgi:hypothetical protein